MSKLEIVSSRHDDLSRWGSRTFSLPELIPEVRELGLVGPLVNPESLPINRALVSQRIAHNILLVNAKTSPKIGPSRCARNTLKHSVTLYNTL